jgi:glutamine amidotransferase-like uncharacterized protein
VKLLERSCTKGHQRHLIFFIFLGITLQILSCVSHKVDIQSMGASEEVILFQPVEYQGVRVGMYADLHSYMDIAKEFGITTKIVDHRFINRRDSFFEKDGRRRFKVLIFSGGESYRWFNQVTGEGITCEGVKNILSFVKSGGSIIGICAASSSLFTSTTEFLNPNLGEARRGEWDKTHRHSGFFKEFCGVSAFKGIIRGPQESNRPYPTVLFLPIQMNPKNEIVRDANLPSIIYQYVVGGGSLIPDEGQPLDVVGWFPNGTAAIGIAPYGKGRIILSNPHPNVTGKRAEQIRKGMGWEEHARRWGWTDEMVRQGRKMMEENSDPDGPEPDWALAKAILSYAYRKASQ